MPQGYWVKGWAVVFYLVYIIERRLCLSFGSLTINMIEKSRRFS